MSTRRLATYYDSYGPAPAPAPAPAPIPGPVLRPAAVPLPYPPPIGYSRYPPQAVPAPLAHTQHVHFAPASVYINQPLPGPYEPRHRGIPAAPRIIFGGRRAPGMEYDQNDVFQVASPHPIEYRKRYYTNAEVLLQVLKFPDTPEYPYGQIIDAVLRSEYPRMEAEKYRLYWRPDWAEKEGAFLRDVLQHKLCQYPEITRALLATGNYELVDGDDRPRQNLLGRTLMSIRDEFKTRG